MFFRQDIPLFRLHVSAMDAYDFEVSLSLAFVLLLRLACVPPPNRSEVLLRVWSAYPGIWTIILTFSALFRVEILCLNS